MKFQEVNNENFWLGVGIILSILTLTVFFHLFYSRFFMREEHLNKIAFEKYLRQINDWEKVKEDRCYYKIIKIGECDLFWLGKDIRHIYTVRFKSTLIFSDHCYCYESRMIENKIQKHLDRLIR